VYGLVFVAELVCVDSPSWGDPFKFGFVYGGKDSIIFPVDRKGMDEFIKILRQTEAEAKIGEKEKLESLERLHRFDPADTNS